MIWKIVIIILCLLWWLPMVYAKWLKRQMKKYDFEIMYSLFRDEANEVTRGMLRLEKAIDNQKMTVNGWEHKIRILDEDIRKLKKELSKQKE